MNQTIDQTVDLDYGDDEDDFEEPKKGGFRVFRAPSFPTPAKKAADASARRPGQAGIRQKPRQLGANLKDRQPRMATFPRGR